MRYCREPTAVWLSSDDDQAVAFAAKVPEGGQADLKATLKPAAIDAKERDIHELRLSV
jgi:hypothetical protein